ncbi:MAG: nucleoside:proton symporter [Proteobacteria bacterium]|nr:nucleoside:proton symporter [Pseudomonadota bacterium]
MNVPANLQSLFGVLVLTAIAAALAPRGQDRPWRRQYRTAAAGLILQFAIAAVILKLPASQQVFLWLNGAVLALQSATDAGTSFVFGYLGGGPLPFEESQPGASFILALRALPLILVMSALSALLFHWRILPVIVSGFAWLLQKAFGIGGAAGLGVAANIFVGMVEAPLLIRPYMTRLSRSELFMIMTCGMATIAGTMMVLYASILAPVLPGALGHLIAASIMSAPAAVMVARLMVPETEPPTEGHLRNPDPPGNAMDAITRGTLDGAALLVNVIAMLIVMVALVHLCNQAIGLLLPDIAGQSVTLQRILGYAMAPVAWLMGLPWAEAVTGGSLLGIKVILNEFLAFLELINLPREALSDRSRLILTYALTGFANLGSLGIMIGGMATIAPSRRQEIVALGMRSVIAGTIATCMTGAIVGILTF